MHKHVEQPSHTIALKKGFAHIVTLCASSLFFVALASHMLKKAKTNTEVLSIKHGLITLNPEQAQYFYYGMGIFMVLLFFLGIAAIAQKFISSNRVNIYEGAIDIPQLLRRSNRLIRFSELQDVYTQKNGNSRSIIIYANSKKSSLNRLTFQNKNDYALVENLLTRQAMSLPKVRERITENIRKRHGVKKRSVIDVILLVLATVLLLDALAGIFFQTMYLPNKQKGLIVASGDGARMMGVIFLSMAVYLVLILKLYNSKFHSKLPTTLKLLFPYIGSLLLIVILFITLVVIENVFPEIAGEKITDRIIQRTKEKAQNRNVIETVPLNSTAKTWAKEEIRQLLHGKSDQEHHDFSKRYGDKSNLQTGEFAFFGWQGPSCPEKSYKPCSSKSCVVDYAGCVSGSAEVLDVHAGEPADRSCVSSWWTYVCK